MIQIETVVKVGSVDNGWEDLWCDLYRTEGPLTERTISNWSKSVAVALKRVMKQALRKGRERASPKKAQVEKITPEMISAGVDEIVDFNLSRDDPGEVVRRVLVAGMSAARKVE